MALKVEEREGMGFYWVLLEAHEHIEASDGLHYRVSRAAASPRASYWEALVLGMSELRRTQSEASDDAASTDGITLARAVCDEDGLGDLGRMADAGRTGPGSTGTAAGIG